MKISDFKLTSISFSVHTNPNTRHEFANVHHGFLSLRGIIPDEWVTTNASYTQPSFSLNYSNGINLFGDQRTFQVTQTGELDIEEGDVALNLLVQYLTLISPETFEVAGVQLELQTPQKDSREWAAEQLIHPRFAKHNVNQIQPVVLLTIPIGNMMVNLGFVTGDEVNGKFDADLLRVTIHAIHEPFLSSGDLLNWFHEWPIQKDRLLQTLFMFFEDKNDTSTN